MVKKVAVRLTGIPSVIVGLLFNSANNSMYLALF